MWENYIKPSLLIAWYLFSISMDLVVIAVSTGLIFGVLHLGKGPNWNSFINLF